MNLLTLVVQDKMNVNIEGNYITISIPKSCKQDLLGAQIEFWLEDSSGRFKKCGFFRLDHDNNFKVTVI